MANDLYAHCGISRNGEFRVPAVRSDLRASDNPPMPKVANPLSAQAKLYQAHLRAWRKARKLTLEKLAEQTGYAVSTLSGWEKGNREVGTEDLVRLAAFYGVHPAALLMAPEDAGPKISRMIEASGLAERLEDDKADQWLALGRTLGGDPPKS